MLDKTIDYFFVKSISINLKCKIIFYKIQGVKANEYKKR